MEPDTLYEIRFRVYIRKNSDTPLQTSLGSRTDASQSMALSPLMPPTTCSTYSEGMLENCARTRLGEPYLDIAEDGLPMLSFL